MPYISPTDRIKVSERGPVTAGELNFVFTSVLLEFWERSGKTYAAINDIIGALEGAKLEFYRRVAVPYEVKKINTNGDVYIERSVPPSSENPTS